MTTHRTNSSNRLPAVLSQNIVEIFKETDFPSTIVVEGRTVHPLETQKTYLLLDEFELQNELFLGVNAEVAIFSSDPFLAITLPAGGDYITSRFDTDNINGVGLAVGGMIAIIAPISTGDLLDGDIVNIQTPLYMLSGVVVSNVNIGAGSFEVLSPFLGTDTGQWNRAPKGLINQTLVRGTQATPSGGVLNLRYRSVPGSYCVTDGSTCENVASAFISTDVDRLSHTDCNFLEMGGQGMVISDCISGRVSRCNYTLHPTQTLGSFNLNITAVSRPMNLIVNDCSFQGVPVLAPITLGIFSSGNNIVITNTYDTAATAPQSLFSTLSSADETNPQVHVSQCGHQANSPVINLLPDVNRDVGQVKVNGRDGSTITYTMVAGVPQIVSYDDAAATGALDVSAPPTTTWPLTTGSTADSEFFDDTNNTFLENKVPGQFTLWRLQFSYTGKANNQSSYFIAKFENTLSGFTTEVLYDITDALTAGEFTLFLVTIADGASLPAPFGTGQGYQFSVETELVFDVTIESVVRESSTVQPALASIA